MFELAFHLSFIGRSNCLDSMEHLAGEGKETKGGMREGRGKRLVPIVDSFPCSPLQLQIDPNSIHLPVSVYLPVLALVEDLSFLNLRASATPLL